MIAIRIIPDRQRLAILRAGRFRRLIGPGIVIRLAMPGTSFYRIAVGNRGQLAAMNPARFGDASLPVEVRGAVTSGTVRMTDFHSDTINVAPDDADAATVNDAAQLDDRAARLPFSPRQFRIGLSIVMIFSAATWGGILHAADHQMQSLSVSELKRQAAAPRVYSVAAYVVHKDDKCPPCPPGAVCETCVLGIYVADDNRPRKRGEVLSDGIYLRTNKAQEFWIGTRYLFKIRYRLEKGAAGAWRQTGPELVDFAPVAPGNEAERTSAGRSGRSMP